MISSGQWSRGLTKRAAVRPAQDPWRASRTDTSVPSPRPDSVQPYLGIGHPDLAVHGFLTGSSLPTQDFLHRPEIRTRHPSPLLPADHSSAASPAKPTHRPTTTASCRPVSRYLPQHRATTDCYFHPVSPIPILSTKNHGCPSQPRRSLSFPP